MEKKILRQRRLDLGLTMKEVADYVGVSEATVQRWEVGNIANMRRDRIQKLSEILRISPLNIIDIASTVEAVKKEKPALSDELKKISDDDLEKVFMKLLAGKDKQYLQDLAYQILTLANTK